MSKSAKEIRYRVCFVPLCKNTTISAPDKIFFHVPKDKKTRKTWLRKARRDGTFSEKTVLWCCEDHFDIKNDMDNYIRFSLIGGRNNLKKEVVPHIFACQSSKSSAFLKRNHQECIKEILGESSTHGETMNVDNDLAPKRLQTEENHEGSIPEIEKMAKKEVFNDQSRGLIKNVLDYFEKKKEETSGYFSAVDCASEALKISKTTIARIKNEEDNIEEGAVKRIAPKSPDIDFGHESSQFIPIAPKKPNNDMANYTDFRFTHQNTMERTLNTSVGTCTTYSSTDQMQQTNMSESCEPLLGVYIKEEKLDEIIPCDLCLDVFCSMENLMRHVNDKHMKIEINEEPLEKKIKQENNVEDDIHMNDDSFRVEIKEEIIDQIKKEETEQIEEDIS